MPAQSRLTAVAHLKAARDTEAEGGDHRLRSQYGLVVAVPAVLAFNWLQRRNKSIAEDLNGFSVDLLGYLMSNGQVRPAVAAAPTAAARPAAAPTKA